MRKNIIFTVIGTTMATILLVILFEIGFRFIHFFYPFMDKFDLSRIAQIYSGHSFLNHTLTPNLNFQRPAYAYVNIPGYHLRTNELGFRFNMKRFKSKRSNVLRIAILGDSLIEGYDEDYTLPSLLEADLHPFLKNSKGVEVMNFGVSSHSTLIHYVNLKKNVLGFRPDLVIVHFDLTDVFDDDFRYKDLTVWDDDGNPESVNPSIAYSMNINGIPVSVFALGKKLSELRPFYSFRRIRISLIEKCYFLKYVYFKTHSPEEILSIYFRELDLVYPKISFKKNMIPFHVPILEYEKAAEKLRTLYYSDNMHPNNEGQKIWSDALAQFLLGNVLAVHYPDYFQQLAP